MGEMSYQEDNNHKKYIIVNLQVEGFHRWISCPNDNRISFLKNQHRHIFFITLKKEVRHNDRDIEIISFKREVISFLQKHFYDSESITFVLNFEGRSCEDLAEILLNHFDCEMVRVLEDNENGAEIQK